MGRHYLAVISDGDSNWNSGDSSLGPGGYRRCNDDRAGRGCGDAIGGGRPKNGDDGRPWRLRRAAPASTSSRTWRRSYAWCVRKRRCRFCKVCNRKVFDFCERVKVLHVTEEKEKFISQNVRRINKSDDCCQF